MTLNEAIKHAEEVAEHYFNTAVYIMDKIKSDIAIIKAEECKRCAEEHRQLAEWLKELKQLREQTRWIPVNDKYEYHIDHTDCIWYGNDRGCPCTCSQYRDGWNDAMNYIFKDGKGYQPYRRNTDG